MTERIRKGLSERRKKREVMSHGTSKRKLAPLCLGQDQKIEPDDYHITVAKCTAELLPVGFSFSVGKFKRISSQRLYDSTNRHI